LEIEKLDLPPNVSIKSGRRSLIKKYMNLSSILRPLIRADSESNSKVIAFVDKARLSLIWLLLSLYFGKFMMLDFEGKRKYASSNIVVAGFFQKNISFNSENIALIKKLLSNNLIDSTSNKLQAKKTLGIHVRNGDYKDNPNFGVLSIEYYQRAIRSINQNMEFSTIRIFTEEENYAADLCSMLSKSYVVEIVTKHKIGSELQTLQLMSGCDAFIMANSTFGWWGGLMISHQTNVLFPSPWFKSNANFEPSFSPDWKQVGSTFQD
jgi:hypothetical protein